MVPGYSEGRSRTRLAMFLLFGQKPTKATQVRVYFVSKFKDTDIHPEKSWGQDLVADGYIFI